MSFSSALFRNLNKNIEDQRSSVSSGSSTALPCIKRGGGPRRKIHSEKHLGSKYALMQNYHSVLDQEEKAQRKLRSSKFKIFAKRPSKFKLEARPSKMIEVVPLSIKKDVKPIPILNNLNNLLSPDIFNKNKRELETINGPKEKNPLLSKIKRRCKLNIFQ